MRTRWLILLWLLSAAWLVWWAGLNPLPDGFQNEYLHIGNAFDLWGALVDLDQWHLRWFMYTGYWPWGLYAVPWPFMAALGASRLALLLGNLVHLAVLLWGANALGRALDARLAPVLLVLTPGVFGTLTRFEPNLAAVAWTVAGLAFLVRSRGLRERRAVLGWGLCLGVGLMMDRLTVGFFLLPAVVPLVPRLARHREWKNLGLGLLAALLLTGAYYREFFIRHSAELLGQAPVGEIDSAGAVSAASGLSAWAWYPLALLDSQAGPIIGALMVLGVVLALRELVLGRRSEGVWRPRAVLLASILAPLLLFTLLPKKQVFYTLPALGPLAVLAARRRRLAWLGVAGGLWTFGATGLGLLPSGFPATPWMPVSWVAPRHTLARPPSRQRWPLDEALGRLDEAGVSSLSVLSEDDTLFEGFVILVARERLPHRGVRGVILDPVGTYELLSDSDGLLLVGAHGVDWPDEAVIDHELLSDHYDISALPPVASLVAAAGDDFTEIGRWTAEGVDVVAYHRRAPR